jgi:hypothetical protein
MLNHLKNPPEPFGDVIRTHFRLKARSILKQLDEWVELDDSRPLNGDGAYAAPNVPKASGSSNGFAEDVNELRNLLNPLLAGGSVDGSSSSSSL